MCCNTIPRRLLLTIAALGLVIGLIQFTQAYAEPGADAPATAGADAAAELPAVLNFDVKDIEGNDVHLGQYYGDVVLIVNTASRCGLTPQYEQLQKLHETYAEAGLSILGFPANNFRSQEPGSDKEISAFCTKNYGVQFAMFSKISVKGDDQAPLYAYLTGEETNGQFAGDIRWNFDKFLVGRDGQVVARFAPRTKPDAKEILDAIAAELEKEMPQAAREARQAAEAEAEKSDDVQ